MTPKKIDIHDEDISADENETPKESLKEINKLKLDIQRINALLNAPLAFESVPNKIHLGWHRELEFCKERLQQLKSPLKIDKK
ncbi:hypothetical protein JW911_02985 [Candidatus Peregrinibacteria bacterium]|nr:hypothetical protein [Candidatus Peregrinibacteria bacterium]